MNLAGLRRLREALPFGPALHQALREPYYRMMSALYSKGAPLTLSNGDLVRIHPRLLGMHTETYEPELAPLLVSLAAAGSTVIDIGAHVGLHSLILSRAVGPKGRVIAIEPSPANAELLGQHLEWNACGNVRVIQAAVSDHEGEATFSFIADATNAGSFANSLAYDIGGESTQVRLITLDGLGEDINPALIKIDVEGAELLVLRGAEKLLARARPITVVAIHPEPMRAMGTSPKQLIKFMSERGFAGTDLAGRPVTDAGFEEIVFRHTLDG